MEKEETEDDILDRIMEDRAEAMRKDLETRRRSERRRPKKECDNPWA